MQINSNITVNNFWVDKNSMQRLLLFENYVDLRTQQNRPKFICYFVFECSKKSQKLTNVHVALALDRVIFDAAHVFNGVK